MSAADDTIQMAKLTAEQTKTFNWLVRTGDSEELALETVLGMKEVSAEIKEFYRFALTH